MIVMVRDRELSDAQESGMNDAWFRHEVPERTKSCDFPASITTATDEENGGRFSNPNPKANSWSAFYRPLLEHVRVRSTEI